MDKLQSSGALRTRQRSDFAWQPSLLSSDPLPPGNPGANQSVGALGVVESRAWGPPLFVAVANGRIRNISGCPGDSVICHRITFENGTWNEATAAAAPAPGPAAAAAAAHATAPAARRERLCSNEAARPEVGPPARAPFPRPTCCQSLRVPGAWNSGERGGWNWGHPFAPSPGPLCKPRLLQRPRASPGRSRAGTFLAWLVVRPHLGTRECMERCGDLLFHHATRVVFLLPSATIPQSPPNTHTHAPCIPPHPRCLDVCEALWQIPSRRSR
jgi:hypothetical protein